MNHGNYGQTKQAMPQRDARMGGTGPIYEGRSGELLGGARLETGPAPTSEIVGKIDGLGAAIDNLHQSMCALDQRLHAVMAFETPQSASDNKCSLPQNSCHMADKLDELRTRVNGTATVLHSIMNRLAL